MTLFNASERRSSRSGRGKVRAHDAKPLRLCALCVRIAPTVAVCELRPGVLSRRGAEAQRASRRELDNRHNKTAETAESAEGRRLPGARPDRERRTSGTPTAPISANRKSQSGLTLFNASERRCSRSGRGENRAHVAKPLPLRALCVRIAPTVAVCVCFDTMASRGGRGGAEASRRELDNRHTEATETGESADCRARVRTRSGGYHWRRQ
ncbi:MAG: hypothetical protein K2I45_07355, partial [Muribaculaceae bacterium]|nr:hypothetical protein [Muribaculaceae bacterium]